MSNSSTGRRRPPLAVRASAIIAQVLALGAALTAFDLVLAAVDWEHHHRADYIREHGPTFASQAFLWVSAGIAAAMTILLVTGANRALRGVTDVLLIAALVGATAVIVSGLWTGSGVLATVLRLILPGVALAVLLIGRVRPKTRTRSSQGSGSAISSRRCLTRHLSRSRG